MPFSDLRQIALAFPRGAHQELFIEGVCCYANENDYNWTYTVAPESLSLSIVDLNDWHGDGILAALNTEQEASCAAQSKVPIVNISSALEDTPVPRSMVDNQRIGQLAAEHLLSRGFKHLAFYGLDKVDYSKKRWKGFNELLAGSGLTSEKLLSTPTFRFDGKVWLDQHRELSKWLLALPKPCGVLAVSDYRARYVLDACRQASIDTPDQIAVIGVDNEPFICEHVTPRLTSVARNNLKEGYRAAEMLDRLMQGKELDSHEAVVPPLQVEERDSTAAFAVTDARLRLALTYLHEYLEDPITVDEMATHASVSRRWLEYAFRDVFGETPFQYIRRQRLLRAKRLLGDEAKTKINEVAKRTGFASTKQMRLAFLQAFGVSPGEFRRQHLMKEEQSPHAS